MKIHIVQKGDTLWKIAKKYGVNFEELKKMNSQLSNPDMIMPGMKIKVPASGGNVKKEAPITGTKINLGSKKEQPMKELPFAKEKPKEIPIKEIPKEAPVQEVPIMEAPPEVPKVQLPKAKVPKAEVPKAQLPIQEPPKGQLPVKEVPKAQVPKAQLPITEAPKAKVPKAQLPITEAPKAKMPNVQLPITEVPKKPFTPKMPKPIIPETEMNDYYISNMANLAQQPHMQPQQAPVPAQKPLPQLPPKPKNILPEIKSFGPKHEDMMDESSMQIPINQGGFTQPMFPFQQNVYPVSPMTSAGFGFPGGYAPQYGTPLPQVQGAMTGPMYGQMPGVGGAGYMPNQDDYYDDESSPFMPQMPLMPNTSPMMSQPNQAPAVMGAEDFQNAQLPLMPAEPAYTAPAMVAPYPYPPYPAYLYPASPVLPGPGPIPAYGDPFGGYPAMPQVMGAMEEMESPGMMGNMPYQMPMAPNMPPSAVAGVTEDCGCDGSNLLGTYGPGMAGGYMYGRGYSPEMTGGQMTGGGYYPGMTGGQMTGGGYYPGMTGGQITGGGYYPGMTGGQMTWGGQHPGMAGGQMTWGGQHPGMAGGYMHDGGYGSGMAGGYMPGAGFGPGMTGGHMPGAGYDYGMGGGFAPGAGYGPGMFGYPSGAGYGPGTTGFSPGMYGPSYGQPFTGQPFMNPYGSTGAEQGMGRNPDEFEEENED